MLPFLVFQSQFLLVDKVIEKETERLHQTRDIGQERTEETVSWLVHQPPDFQRGNYSRGEIIQVDAHPVGPIKMVV